MTTLSQARSDFALQKLISEKNQIDKEFGSYMSGLPSMVLTNGLAQAFAFIIQKEKPNKAKRKVIDWTIEWLAKKGWVQGDPSKLSGDHLAFMELLSMMDQASYLACQRETLSFWEWLKRYANSDMFQN